ncbi:MAG: ChbG/HpnK family deacetylase [Chloroflexales bacterium]|nr:ChbG/HpnK family deacetylase [Chloroflexales bacterium]
MAVSVHELQEVVVKHTAPSHVNAIFGYPPDARLLILNADDFGMCHAVNAGITEARRAGLITSCTLMVPCPWSLHARKLLRDAPEAAFGIHLTAISEQPDYRWGPVLGRRQVPSLVDEAGYFYPEVRIDELLERADPAELEQEFRAQIETVLDAGLTPTHLDSHCGVHSRRAWTFALTVRLAHEYGLAVRVSPTPFADGLQQQGYPMLDHPLLDSYDLEIAGKASWYAQLLRTLPAGVSEWALHPGIGNAELRAAMPSWEVRQTDLAFVTSREARQIIEEEGIVLLNYRMVQEVWQAIYERTQRGGAG